MALAHWFTSLKAALHGRVQQLFSRLPLLCVIVGAITLVALIDSESKYLTLLRYPALAAICIGIMSRAYKMRPVVHVRVAKSAIILLTIATLYWFAHVETYTTHCWRNGDKRYSETYSRFHGLTYLRIVSWEPSNLWSCEGPLIVGAYGPVRHGEWTLCFLSPMQPAVHEFFWYGEKVSEGDWHLKSGS